jgi:hypothetical protein
MLLQPWQHPVVLSGLVGTEAIGALPVCGAQNQSTAEGLFRVVVLGSASNDVDCA